MKRKSKESVKAAAPELYACVKSFLSNWPQFDATSEEYDTDVNGADLVDWLSEQAPHWMDAIRKAEGKAKEEL